METWTKDKNDPSNDGYVIIIVRSKKYSCPIGSEQQTADEIATSLDA